MDKRILNLLYRLKLKPAVLLGEKSLLRLDGFLSGYIWRITECEGNAFKGFHRPFREFLEKRYHQPGGYGWYMLIANDSADEADAFDKFYALLDEFLAENGEVPFSDAQAKYIYLDEKTRNHYEKIGCFETK